MVIRPLDECTYWVRSLVACIGSYRLATTFKLKFIRGTFRPLVWRVGDGRWLWNAPNSTAHPLAPITSPLTRMVYLLTVEYFSAIIFRFGPSTLPSLRRRGKDAKYRRFVERQNMFRYNIIYRYIDMRNIFMPDVNVSRIPTGLKCIA